MDINSILQIVTVIILIVLLVDAYNGFKLTSKISGLDPEEIKKEIVNGVTELKELLSTVKENASKIPELISSIKEVIELIKEFKTNFNKLDNKIEETNTKLQETNSKIQTMSFNQNLIERKIDTINNTQQEQLKSK